MAANPNPVELPDTVATYHFVSVHRIVGLSALPNGANATLAIGVQNAQILLTADPNPLLEDADRDAALRFAALQALFQHDAPQLTLAQRTQQIAVDRAQKFGNGVYLIIKVTGTTTMAATTGNRLPSGELIAYDVIDKHSVAKRHAALVDNCVTALALLVTQTPEISDCLQSTYLILPDGSPLHSITLTGGPANLLTSRPMTAEEVQETEVRVRALAKDHSLEPPTRLLSDALRSKDALESFLLAWGGLDILVNKYGSQAKLQNGEWINRVPDAKHHLAAEVHKSFIASGTAYYSLPQKVSAFVLLHNVELPQLEAFTRLNGTYRIPLAHKGEIPPPGAAEQSIALLRALLRARVNNLLNGPDEASGSAPRNWLVRAKDLVLRFLHTFGW